MLSIAGSVLPLGLALKTREPRDLALIGFAFRAKSVDSESLGGPTVVATLNEPA